LYGDAPLPTWVGKLKLDTIFAFHNAKKLFRNEPIMSSLGRPGSNRQTDERTKTDSLGGSLARQTWAHWALTMSSPERAILELLDEIPARETFHQADMLIEGLRNLSPRKLQKLILDCRSVKVKRRQVALLIKVVPFVGVEKCFALKGGTAINLFVRSMPRFPSILI
jgi:hypothetical protein